MGYRDDFYIVANIIGITGPLHELPSVYFQDKATGEFGHITQVHKHSFNWGRTEVRVDPNWKITNDCPANCTKKRPHKKSSHEINGKGKVFHVSRDEFKSDLSKEDLSVAAQAIYRCPYMKTDPGHAAQREEQEEGYLDDWYDAHAKGPGGRRGAIDYTGEGLANRALGIAYPNRTK